jgi:hypothetical protein
LKFELFGLPGCSDIYKARSVVCSDFLYRSEHDYLFYLDSDVDIEAADVERLIALCEAEGYDIVGAPYALRNTIKGKKNDGSYLAVDWLVEEGEEGPTLVQSKRTGLLKVYRIGGGCQVISRQAATALAYKQPLFYEEDRVCALFAGCTVGPIYSSKTPTRPHLLGEDYTLCDRWRELGGSVWLDPTIHLIHAGLPAKLPRLEEYNVRVE